MASQRGRRTARRVIHDPDFDYGLGPSSSEQGSQNTVVSEQNDDSDSSYQENTQLSNASEENVVAAIQEGEGEGEQSSSEENENDQTPRARWLRKWVIFYYFFLKFKYYWKIFAKKNIYGYFPLCFTF